MKTKTTIILFMAVLWSMVCIPAVMADQKGEELAVKAASKWLALVDEGKYSESWDEAAQLFKGAVNTYKAPVCQEEKRS